MTTTSYILTCYSYDGSAPAVIGVYATDTAAISKMSSTVTAKIAEGQAAYPTGTTFDSITSVDGLSSCVRMTSSASMTVNCGGVNYPDFTLTRSAQSYYVVLTVTSATNA